MPSAGSTDRDDDSDLAPIAKRHDNAHAGARAIGVRVVDLVGEGAEERKREGDGDEHGRKLPPRHRQVKMADEPAAVGMPRGRRTMNVVPSPNSLSHAHLAAELVREPARDAQPEPSSAERSRARLIELAEIFPDRVDLFRLDADARVADLEQHRASARIAPRAALDRDS